MSNSISRRHFVKTMMVAGISLQIPAYALSMFKPGSKMTKIGIITDLHHDVIHNGLERLKVFTDHMKTVRPDALLQMGDLAYPDVKNKVVIDLFNNAHKVRMHVIGNHDTDGGHTKQQCIDYWDMPDRYYTKDINGIRFVILDGNEKGPNYKKGYPNNINKEQADWLENQLKEADKPVIVICHQPLAGALEVDNAKEIQGILTKYSKKILIAINGHTHIDSHHFIGGVNYVHINSASYFWMGDKFKHNSYSEQIHKEHPYICYTCPYKDSLYTTLSVNPTTGHISIEGCKSEWVGPSPKELNYFDKDAMALPGEIVPWISQRHFKKIVAST